MLACLIAGALSHVEIQAQTPEALILNGFHASVPANNPRPVLFNGTRYRFQAAGVPISRAAIRQANVLYFDRLPDGVEFFRDDMEAVHKLVSDGGVAFLIAGGDTSDATIAAFNYLGGRFNFSFSERARPDQILPVEPFNGILGGNVWYCAGGVRTLTLDSPDWLVRYRDASTGRPVIATRQIGQGLMVLMGTNEIDRPTGIPPQTGLTVVDWARTALGENTATTISFPTVIQATSTRQIEQAINNPQSDAIAERVRQLRGVYFPGRQAGVSDLLVPADQRPLLNRPRQLVDADGRAVIPDYFNRQQTLIVAWATWEPASMDYLREIAQLAESLSPAPQILAVNLDADRDAFRSARAEFNLPGWTHLHDGHALATPLARSLGVVSVPRAFLVDRNSRVASIDPPAPMAEDLIARLRNGQSIAIQ